MRKNLTPKNNKKDIMSLVYVCFGIAIFTFLFTYFSNMLVQKSYKLSYDELFYDRVFWGLDLRNNIIFHGFSTILVKRIIESKYFVNYKNVLNILFLIKSFLSALTSVLMFLIVKRISCANNLTKILLAVFTTILIFSKPGILVEVPLNVLCVLGIICFYSQSFFCKGKIKPIVFNLLVIIFAIILISNSFSMLFLVPAIVFILLKNPKNKIINIVSSIVLVVAGILIVLYFYYQYVPNNIYPGSIIENISNTPQYLVSKMEKAVLTLKSDWKSFFVLFDFAIANIWFFNIFTLGTLAFVFVGFIRNKSLFLRLISAFIYFSYVFLATYNMIIYFSDFYMYREMYPSVFRYIFDVENTYVLVPLILVVGINFLSQRNKRGYDRKICFYYLLYNALTIIYLIFRVIVPTSKIESYPLLKFVTNTIPLYGWMPVQNTVGYGIVLLIFISFTTIGIAWFFHNERAERVLSLLLILAILESGMRLYTPKNERANREFLLYDRRKDYVEKLEDFYILKKDPVLQMQYPDTVLKVWSEDSNQKHFLIYFENFADIASDSFFLQKDTYIYMLNNTSGFVFCGNDIKQTFSRQNKVEIYGSRYAIDNLITRAYLYFFERPIDSSGFEFFYNKIVYEGVGIDEFLDYLMISQEFVNKGYTPAEKLSRIYMILFDAEIDEAVLNDWVIKTGNATNLTSFYDEYIDEDQYSEIIEFLAEESNVES